MWLSTFALVKESLHSFWMVVWRRRMTAKACCSWSLSNRRSFCSCPKHVEPPSSYTIPELSRRNPFEAYLAVIILLTFNKWIFAILVTELWWGIVRDDLVNSSKSSSVNIAACDFPCAQIFGVITLQCLYKISAVKCITVNTHVYITYLVVFSKDMWQ